MLPAPLPERAPSQPLDRPLRQSLKRLISVHHPWFWSSATRIVAGDRLITGIREPLRTAGSHDTCTTRKVARIFAHPSIPHVRLGADKSRRNPLKSPVPASRARNLSPWPAIRANNSKTVSQSVACVSEARVPLDFPCVSGGRDYVGTSPRNHGPFVDSCCVPHELAVESSLRRIQSADGCESTPQSRVSCGAGRGCDFPQQHSETNTVRFILHGEFQWPPKTNAPDSR